MATGSARVGELSSGVERAILHMRADQQLQGKPRQGAQVEKHIARRKRTTGFPMSPSGGGNPQIVRGCGDLESFLLAPPFQPFSKNGAIREMVVVRGQFHRGMTRMAITITPRPHGPPQ